MAYETININAKQSARIEAKRVKQLRKTNYKEYATFKYKARKEYHEVNEFATGYIKNAYKVRHDDHIVFNNILDTIHLTKYLKALCANLA